MQLIGAKDKHVITCLEYIREYMTKRLVNVKKVQAKSNGLLTPFAEGVFNDIKEATSHMNVLMADSSKYQVKRVKCSSFSNTVLLMLEIIFTGE
ncbi:hypothetical protein HanPI659440_Chr09g0357501 [Helianthus annuus]|nr:hypothetical protein HanPI659440_Chr09g0357501 [Helianthus annuus]